MIYLNSPILPHLLCSSLKSAQVNEIWKQKIHRKFLVTATAMFNAMIYIWNFSVYNTLSKIPNTPLSPLI